MLIKMNKKNEYVWVDQDELQNMISYLSRQNKVLSILLSASILLWIANAVLIYFNS
jgi:hypothetical protein